METKHTPGPWSLRDWETHDRDGAIEACGYEVVDANGHAVSAGVVEGATEAEEANARLIAAAPDLLEALVKLYGAIDSCVDLTPGKLHAARAAIAKATGAA